MKDAIVTGEAFNSQETIERFKTWNFLTFILFLRSFFAPLDPNPDPADKNLCVSVSSILQSFLFFTFLPLDITNDKSNCWFRLEVEETACCELGPGFIFNDSQHWLMPYHLTDPPPPTPYRCWLSTKYERLKGFLYSISTSHITLQGFPRLLE